MNKFGITGLFLLTLSRVFLFADSPDFSFEEKLCIESHPVIRVHNENDWAPFNFNERGVPSGFSIEYIQKLGDMAGLKIEFISGYSWSDYLEMIRKKDVDVMVNIVQTQEREEFLNFTDPFIQYSPSLFIRQSASQIHSIEDLYGKTFALQDGFFYEEIISRHPEIDIRRVPNSTEAVLAVSRGEADAMIDLMPIVNYLTDSLLITNLKPGGSIELDNGGITLARIGIRKDWPVLAEILNKCIEIFPEEELQKLRSKWLGNDDNHQMIQSLVLESGEKKFLADHPVLKVYSTDKLPPFTDNSNGDPRGLSIDYMDTIAASLGVEAEYVQGPWSEGMEALSTGKADILLNTTLTPDRQKSLLFAGPYAANPQIIISSEDQSYTSLDSLEGKKVAMAEGYFYKEILEISYPGIILIEKSDLLESLKSVIYGEADAAFGDYAVSQHLIRENFLSNLRLSGEINLGDPGYENLYFSVSGDRPLLHSIIQKAWESIPPEETNRIRSKWISALTPPTSFDETESLKEKDFPLGRIIILSLLLISGAALLQRVFWNRKELGEKLDIRRIRIFSLLFLIINIIVMMLIASVGLIYVRASIKRDVEKNLQAIVSTTNEGLSIWIEHKLDILRTESSNPGLIELTDRLAQLPGSKGILTASNYQNELALLTRGSSLLSSAEGYYLIKSDGTNLAARNREETGDRNRILDYRPELLERAFLGETLFIPPIPARNNSTENRISGDISMFFASPVFDNRGRILAVLAVQEDPAKEFTRYCQMGQIGRSGETYAFDDMGYLLSQSRFEEDLRQRGLLGRDDSSILSVSLHQPLPESPDEAPFTRMAASALSGRSGSDTSGYIDYRGVKVYGAWIWNRDLNFALATEMDESDAMATYTGMKRLIYVVLAIILITATGTTLFSITVGERANRSLSAVNNSLEERVLQRTKEVRETSRNLRNTIEALTHPFYVIDADTYQVILANSAARALSLDSTVTSCHALTHRKNHPCSNIDHPCPVPLIKESREPVTLEHLHYDADGEPVYVEVYGYPIFNDEDEVEQIIEYSIDITDRKNAQIELGKARDAAEAATRAKSDFLANMSHEIRTPMNAIIGLSHLIQRTKLDAKQMDYIHKISASAQNLLGIINDILDFSKIEAGKLSMENIRFDLHEVFENLGSMISTKAREKNLELVFHVGQDIPGRLTGDPLRLGQILLNLANNAIKFTEDGEIAVSSELVQRKENRAVLKFSVRDTGIGLTEEQSGRLFQAFSQADNSTTRKYGGTGLGLSISKRLAEMMGGEIGVESRYGEGSTFFFTADFAIAEETKKVIVPEEMIDLNVLIVDDNSTSQEVLKEYIESFSFRAEAVDNGLEAIQLIRKQRDQGWDPFRLILMDYSMPGLNGFQTADKINEILKEEDRPKYILVTGYGRDEVLRGLEKHGFEGFVLKPVNQSLLFNTIIEAFGQKSVRPGRSLSIEYPEGFDSVRGARILLTEDNQINQEVARELLEGEGFYVDIAANGRESLLMVQEKEYDITLMDLQMPVMDGYEATREIRKLEGYDAYPVLAMTADAMSGVREEVLKAGMNDYITKPIDQSQLWRALVKWIKPGERVLPEGYSKRALIEPEMQKIDGLDTEGALERIGGSTSFYHRLLMNFHRDFSGFPAELDRLIEENRQEEAVRLVHSLKGVSANLGADSLSELAMNLETGLKEGTEEASRGIMMELSANLKTLMANIAGLEEKEKKEEEPTGELPEGVLSEQLSSAIEHLKKRKPQPAQKSIRLLRSYTLPEETSTALDRAEELMGKYRLKEAAAVLEQISI